MNSKKMEELMDEVTWYEYDDYPSLDGLQATHEGKLVIDEFSFRCYKLNDGSIVLNADDVEQFFGDLF